MNMIQSLSSSPSHPLPVYALMISCVGYGVGRVLLKVIHENKHSLGLGSGLDQAEKGGLKRQEGMTDVDIFQLEKRAFFSKVGGVISMPGVLSFRRAGTDSKKDMALRLSPKQICETRRLPCVRGCRYLVLCRFGERPEVACIS